MTSCASLSETSVRTILGSMPSILLDNPGSSLVFLGAYTDYDTLPHYPRVRNDWASGFTTARWTSGKLQPLSVTACHNPAFMK